MHNLYHAGQAEQWRRIARIRLHQSQQDYEAGASSELEKPHLNSQEPGAEVAHAEPLSKHAAAKIRQAFEHIISSEELPRKPRTTGSLTDHLITDSDSGKHAKRMSQVTKSLEQIHATNVRILGSRAQHRKLTLAGS